MLYNYCLYILLFLFCRQRNWRPEKLINMFSVTWLVSGGIIIWGWNSLAPSCVTTKFCSAFLLHGSPQGSNPLMSRLCIHSCFPREPEALAGPAELIFYQPLFLTPENSNWSLAFLFSWLTSSLLSESRTSIYDTQIGEEKLLYISWSLPCALRFRG